MAGDILILIVRRIVEIPIRDSRFKRIIRVATQFRDSLFQHRDQLYIRT